MWKKIYRPNNKYKHKISWPHNILIALGISLASWLAASRKCASQSPRFLIHPCSLPKKVNKPPKQCKLHSLPQGTAALDLSRARKIFTSQEAAYVSALSILTIAVRIAHFIPPMPSSERDASRESERQHLKHQHSSSSEGSKAIIPMWDSSDPVRILSSFEAVLGKGLSQYY